MMSVKFLTIIALCILGATLSKAGAGMTKEEAIKLFMEATGECQTEAGATPADVDDMMKKQPSTSTAGKCMRACLMKRFHVMDGNGKFVQSVAMEHANMWTGGDAEKMKIAQEVTDVCVGVAVPDDHCEAAEAYGHCLKEQAKAHGIEKMQL